MSSFTRCDWRLAGARRQRQIAGVTIGLAGFDGPFRLAPWTGLLDPVERESKYVFSTATPPAG